MATFILAFVIMMILIIGMSLGVLLNGKTIKGSCGGLNAIADADKCLVCKKDIDPDSPLRDRLADCPRAKDMAKKMAAATLSDGA